MLGTLYPIVEALSVMCEAFCLTVEVRSFMCGAFCLVVEALSLMSGAFWLLGDALSLTRRAFCIAGGALGFMDDAIFPIAEASDLNVELFSLAAEPRSLDVGLTARIENIN